MKLMGCEPDNLDPPERHFPWIVPARGLATRGTGSRGLNRTLWKDLTPLVLGLRQKWGLSIKRTRIRTARHKTSIPSEVRIGKVERLRPDCFSDGTGPGREVRFLALLFGTETRVASAGLSSAGEKCQNLFA